MNEKMVCTLISRTSSGIFVCVLPFVVTLTHIQCPRSLPFLRLCVGHFASSQAGAAVELALDIVQVTSSTLVSS